VILTKTISRHGIRHTDILMDADHNRKACLLEDLLHMTLLSTHNCTTVIYCTISLLLCLRRNSSFKFAMLL